MLGFACRVDPAQRSSAVAFGCARLAGSLAESRATTRRRGDADRQARAYALPLGRAWRVAPLASAKAEGDISNDGRSSGVAAISPAE
jgi:hypothetical protein